MKPRLRLCLIASIAAGLLAALAFTLWIRHEQGRVWMNNQSCGFLATRGRYRSWGIEYSHGQQWVGGRWKNWWHFPTFRHVDMRDFVNVQTNSEWKRILVVPGTSPPTNAPNP